jgi:hypothetical protein
MTPAGSSEIEDDLSTRLPIIPREIAVEVRR